MLLAARLRFPRRGGLSVSVKLREDSEVSGESSIANKSGRAITSACGASVRS